MSVLVGDEAVAIERMIINLFGISQNELYDVLYYHFDRLNNKKISYTNEELKSWLTERRSKGINPMTKEEYTYFINQNRK